MISDGHCSGAQSFIHGSPVRACSSTFGKPSSNGSSPFVTTCFPVSRSWIIPWSIKKRGSAIIFSNLKGWLARFRPLGPSRAPRSYRRWPDTYWRSKLKPRAARPPVRSETQFLERPPCKSGQVHSAPVCCSRRGNRAAFGLDLALVPRGGLRIYVGRLRIADVSGDCRLIDQPHARRLYCR